MNEQELFNQAVVHCATQGRRSTVPDDSDQCLYRGPDGLRCVVGALIFDEEYTSDIEGRVASLVLPDRLVPFANLCDRLQTAHDESESPEKLRQRLRLVARYFDLDSSLVDTITRWS